MEKYQGPSQFKPLSGWKYFGLNILFSIPVVGFVFLLIFTFSNKNINRRNYARSFWCGLLVVVILAAIAVAIALISGGLENIGEALEKLVDSVKEAIPGL